MEPTIREATVSDVHAIRRIAATAWRTVYDDVLSAETIDAALSEWYEPSTIREYVSRADVIYLVATSNNRIRGYAGGSAGETAGVAELGAIYVDPVHWREGFGTALLSAFEERASADGFEAVTLRVLAENDLAQSFYRAAGYEQVESDDTELFGEPVREQVFRRDLDRTGP